MPALLFDRRACGQGRFKRSSAHENGLALQKELKPPLIEEQGLVETIMYIDHQAVTCAFEFDACAMLPIRPIVLV